MKGKLIVVLLILSSVVTGFCGCSNSTYMNTKLLKSYLSGLEVTIRSFDEDSNVIDRIHGESVLVERDETFDTYTDGESNMDSSVLRITIGNHTMNHVGSSLIVAEDGLYDVFEEYVKTIDISNDDKGTPIANRVVNSFKNITTGKQKTILIRSQNGTPLATYIGNRVSVFSGDIPKTTIVLIDDMVLIIYRCDYTIYDTALLLEQ